MEINFITAEYDYRDDETVILCMGHEVTRVTGYGSRGPDYILPEVRMKFDEFLAHSFAEWLAEKEVRF